MNVGLNSISDRTLMLRMIKHAYARPGLKKKLWKEENGIIFVHGKPGEPHTEITFREDGSLNFIRSWE